MRLLLKMAATRPPDKGVTSITSSAIRLDQLLDVYRERGVRSVVAGEKVLSVFSRQKSPKCALGGGGLCPTHREEVSGVGRRLMPIAMPSGLAFGSAMVVLFFGCDVLASYFYYLFLRE